ncbi:MAG: hypothetical protein KAV87_34660 [Desulfobacteraceae bacterium]|nr:hypothetical protein [Desulfobacteraceae bacterium]
MRRRWFLITSFLMLVVLFAGGCGVSQNKYDAATADLEKAQQELLLIKAELAVSQSGISDLTASLEETEIELETLKGELDNIREVWPPQYFPSSMELRDWLAENVVSESPPTTIAETLYMKGLQIQEDALKDGYIISVDLDPGKQEGDWYVACVTVINGDLWAWGPESDAPIEVSSIIGFTKVK